MKKMLFVLLLFIGSFALGQKIVKMEKVTAYSTHVIGDNFEGTVFNKEYISGWLSLRRSAGVIYASADTFFDSKLVEKFKRFNPLTEDISSAEITLQSELRKTEKLIKPSRYSRGPNVYHNLRKYFRQYSGFINDKGDKIILINCFWYNNKREIDMDWLENYNHVFDGGSYYWRIEINLSAHKLFNFGVNGSI